MVDRDLTTSHEIIIGRVPLPGSLWRYKGSTLEVDSVVVRDDGTVLIRVEGGALGRFSIPVTAFLEDFRPTT
jgi:hypothetical protein